MDRLPTSFYRPVLGSMVTPSMPPLESSFLPIPMCALLSHYLSLTFTFSPTLLQIQIPPRGKIYSFNEGNAMFFHPPVLEYLKSIKYPASGKPYSARYIGSMVADVHRTFLYGGIFGYPDDKKNKTGKLRLLYEAFPMAFLTEQVGLFHYWDSFTDK